MIVEILNTPVTVAMVLGLLIGILIAFVLIAFVIIRKDK